MAATLTACVTLLFASADSDATEAAGAFWKVFSVYLTALAGLALHWKRRGHTARAFGVAACVGVSLILCLIQTFRI